MAGTLQDFLRQFAGGSTAGDRDAEEYHKRFISERPDDREFDQHTYNQSTAEYLRKMPDEEFQSAARNAYASAPPQERQGLIGQLMTALSGGSGSSSGGLGGILGSGLQALAGKLSTGARPEEMDPDEYARTMNQVRREHPEVIQQTVQDKPWFVKAMGNPVLMGALTIAAAKMLNKQRGG